jgi:toxin FitB
MFLLDTNVISELRKARNGKAHPNVVNWAESGEATI